MSTRKIKSRWSSMPTMEGAGVKLRRVFGGAEVPRLDPFLLLDDFGSSKPEDYLKGFPWHPHRGIETVTYMLEGIVNHEDSLKNKGTITDGGIQWMSAGSGIIHQEMPQAYTGEMRGFQLWVNLPQKDKMSAPRYQDVKKNDVPEIVHQGAKVKIIAGEMQSGNSVVKGHADDIYASPRYLDVALPANGSFELAVPEGHTLFAFVFEGAGQFDPNEPAVTAKGGFVHYENAGDTVVIKAGESGARFLLVSGKPLGEPVAWYGPIVMNTQEELKTAFAELQEGTFIKQ
jgi:redox-sensitive bicupin YhaK (pirin superfamily)